MVVEIELTNYHLYSHTLVPLRHDADAIEIIVIVLIYIQQYTYSYIFKYILNV